MFLPSFEKKSNMTNGCQGNGVFCGIINIPVNEMKIEFLHVIPLFGKHVYRNVSMFMLCLVVRTYTFL